jgi:anti-anti-sigma regulatory factor
MLKIIITDCSDEQRWSLQGRLVGQWAAELRSAWRDAQRGGDTRRCVIELIDVTFIDRVGEDVLCGNRERRSGGFRQRRVQNAPSQLA